MKVNKEHINKFYNKIALKTLPTQKTYTCIIDRFLKYINDNNTFDITDDNIIQYLKRIKPNSLHASFYAIRFFCDAAVIPINLKISDVSQKSNIKRIKTIMSKEEVEALIKAAKLYCGTIELGYIAVSTVYACRRGEIYNLAPDSINNDKITIFPLKGGMESREHIIPDEIKEIMVDLKYGLSKIKKKPQIELLNMMFDQIAYKAGIQLRPRLGFHSIRRSFISELMLTELNPTIIRHYCRWKPRSSDILLDYTIFQPERVDKMVFEKHPFLPFYK